MKVLKSIRTKNNRYYIFYKEYYFLVDTEELKIVRRASELECKNIKKHEHISEIEIDIPKEILNKLDDYINMLINSRPKPKKIDSLIQEVFDKYSCNTSLSEGDYEHLLDLEDFENAVREYCLKKFNINI